MQLSKLQACRGSQASVEVRQRLVKQEHLWVTHDRPSERDPLALAAREGVRPSLEELRKSQGARNVVHPAVDVGAIDAAPAEAEREILMHAHVRIESVGLEHHRDVPVLRRNGVDDVLVNAEAA